VGAVTDLGAPAYTPAQSRVVAAALELFAVHGVSGTSLQMIADAIGVTKAAVYHQFKTKEEIVLAAAEAELARLVTALDAADAEPSPERAREVLLSGMVDLTIERRRTVSVILSDPVVIPFFAAHAPFRRVMDRLNRHLMGEGAGPDARVRTAMLTAAIAGAGTHPLVVEVEDEKHRTKLQHHTQPNQDQTR
jgi:AcrR family transcriptional regulator